MGEQGLIYFSVTKWKNFFHIASCVEMEYGTHRQALCQPERFQFAYKHAKNPPNSKICKHCLRQRQKIKNS